MTAVFQKGPPTTKDMIAILTAMRNLLRLPEKKLPEETPEILTGIIDELGKPSNSPEKILAEEILKELSHARTKFPGPDITFAALVEEVGELAKALTEESPERIREEAVQVATMAIRVALDGDCTLDSHRAEKGLDPIT